MRQGNSLWIWNRPVLFTIKENTLQSFNIVAKTLYGLEEVLMEELRTIGATEIKPLRRAVMYKGGLDVMYKSNLLLRTAQKILKPIATFEVHNDKQLYSKVKAMRWPDYFSIDQTFAIDGTTQGEVFTHSKYVALKTKDAIVDKFRDQFGRRPNVESNFPDIRINIHISNTTCTVSMDSSGVQLGRRGYRKEQVEAPISETLAAGIILLSKWDRKKPFLDPMCGSGTFPIEAALIAANIPPGKNFKFSFENWDDFDKPLWEKIKSEADQHIVPITTKITGMDNDLNALKISRQNAINAGVENDITFIENDFLANTPELDIGQIIMNPPYGERLKSQEEIIPFYKEIGTALKHHYNGWDAWIISGNIDALKFIGLRPSRKIKLFNGPIESRLEKFELYQGTKRTHKPIKRRSNIN